MTDNSSQPCQFCPLATNQEGPSVVQASAELNPCPFCGGEPILFLNEKNLIFPFEVECSVCRCNTRWNRTEAEAVGKWNMRAEMNKGEIKS